jgi:Ca2+-binding RTX toxin-like protein
MQLDQSDIDFLLAQLQAPRIPASPIDGTGVRDPSGANNNLIPGQGLFGASGQPFDRLTTPTYVEVKTFAAGALGPNMPATTTYSNNSPTAVIVDAAPRQISNLVADQAQISTSPADPLGFNANLVPAYNPAVNPLPDSAALGFFGQFFDHGLDLVHKGQNGVVFVPLAPTDPLYVPGSQTNFMVVSRANFTIDPATGERVYVNTVSPFIDQSQTYGSHPVTTAFLREYDANGVATGRLVSGADGGMATWADIKANALRIGITLTDMDVLDAPQLALNLDGTVALTAGANGRMVARLVTDPATGAVQRTGQAFLDDIARGATPNANGTYDAALLAKHYVAGDGRVNENFGLTAMHHVFHGEHNRVVEDIKALVAARQAADPTFAPWTGEMYFQAAKLVTEMQYQHLVFDEFARRISPNVDEFSGYDVTLNPAISVEFAHAVYRFGHSMMNEELDLVDPATGAVSEVGLISAFLNPAAYDAMGDGDTAAAKLLLGMSRQVGNTIDEFTTNALRNSLLGLPLDLPAINIVRGRDMGIPSLNKVREELYSQTGLASLKPYESWAEFGQALLHPESLVNFIAAYAFGNAADPRAAARAAMQNQAFMHNTLGAGDALKAASQAFWSIDFWLGGLAEEKVVTGGITGRLGATFDFIFAQQMVNLQNADRFYYLDRLAGTNLLVQIEAQKFSDIIERNTGLDNIYGDVFSAPDAVLDLAKPAGFAASPGAGFNARGIFQGGDASELIMATAGNETIRAGKGNDDVSGRGGNDFIDGMEGNDFLDGGAGDDTLIDRDGDDFIRGGTGHDSISAGMGDDEAFGGAGDDTIRGGVGVDDLNGEDGNDRLFGDGNDDVMTGGAGDDVLDGGIGADKLDGGTGNDTLIGGSGPDVLDGGAGDDVLRPGDIGFNNIIDGGAGFDIVSYQDAVVGVTVDLNLAAVPAPPPGRNVRDTYIDVEGAIGSRFADLLIANAGLPGGTLLRGLDGNDTLVGTAAADTLDGGLGADSMVGGAGDDRYVVDDAQAVIVELPGGGADTVAASVTYTMGAGVEVLLLTGADTIGGNGNAAANTLVGNAAGNVLDGMGGADTMYGRGGDDLYIVDNLGDVVVEAAGQGADTISVSFSYTLGANVEGLQLTGAFGLIGIGNAADNRMGGTAATDRLEGGLGADTLDGGAGADVLVGGAGDDVYIVDNVFDQVVEAANGGRDLVFSSVNWTLGFSVNDLVLTGTANLTGTGNNLDNRLTGNAGANTLDGGTDADTMWGGLGDDTYIVDNAGDLVLEELGQGIDTVRSSVSWILWKPLENLVLTGIANINGEGSDVANRMTGNVGANLLQGWADNDTLIGGAGADTLTGGSGRDIFRFSQGDSGLGTARDVVTDFVRGEDRLDIAGIDANVWTLGDQAFTFIGSAAFTAIGQARFAGGVLQLNTDLVLTADIEIALTGVTTLSSSDFALL